MSSWDPKFMIPILYCNHVYVRVVSNPYVELESKLSTGTRVLVLVYYC
jgi:hypothetical protein